MGIIKVCPKSIMNPNPRFHKQSILLKSHNLQCQPHNHSKMQNPKIEQKLFIYLKVTPLHKLHNPQQRKQWNPNPYKIHNPHSLCKPQSHPSKPHTLRPLHSPHRQYNHNLCKIYKTHSPLLHLRTM